MDSILETSYRLSCDGAVWLTQEVHPEPAPLHFLSKVTDEFLWWVAQWGCGALMVFSPGKVTDRQQHNGRMVWVRD